MMNRNKRGIAVNLKLEGGLAVVKRLLADADVVIENYRLGTLDKLGLGYEVLKALNPRLIYCAISGYGRTGPYADKGGFDLIAQGVSGLMSITGRTRRRADEDRRRRSPTSMPASWPRSASSRRWSAAASAARARWSTPR